ncbi:MAG: ATPase [Lysobacteraceae bacterium SCN 69-48]|nr:MAG: ATPase [Xanthomonadaceae bacterium SCN 69-48]
MTDILRIVFVGVAIVAAWFRLWEPFESISLIGLLAALVGGWPIFQEAYESLLERRMTMELSMTIALAAALAIGETVTALVIIFFVLIAEVLEGLTVGRGRKAIEHLVNLLPRTATVRRSGSTSELSADELQIGDVVIVKPGSRLPVDGEVVAGQSAIDQSPITGESIPVEKSEGSQVFAGTINQSGALEVRVTRIGRDTAFGKIIEAVERAEKVRAPIQKTADRLAGYLVYFALGCAIVTFALTRDARATISVIIVAGACGIAAGTPLAILGAIGRAARDGVIVKGGLYLEVLGRVGTVVFDKTGTLTEGRPRVTAIRTVGGATEREVVEAAAIAELKSEHPLAKAVLEKAAELSITPELPNDFRYTPGKGISCSLQGETVVVGNAGFLIEKGVDTSALTSAATGISSVVVARGGRLLGAVEVTDVLRPEAKAAISTLHEMGMKTVMLTGDAETVAKAVGAELGLGVTKAGLLPEEKVKEIRALRASGQSVVMLGDGINDAPALMEATVGVAMAAGTDVARESADVVLIGNDLLRFVEAVRLARRCHRIILANFVGTIAVDAIGVGLAALGYLNPLIAALIHVVSELAFILNSARLLPATTAAADDMTPMRSELGERVSGEAVEMALGNGRSQ